MTPFTIYLLVIIKLTQSQDVTTFLAPESSQGSNDRGTAIDPTEVSDKTTILFSNFYNASMSPQVEYKVENPDIDNKGKLSTEDPRTEGFVDVPKTDDSDLQQVYDLERLKSVNHHNCRRPCDGQKMVCYYKLSIEHYHTMSKACYDCPYNVSDCFRPHCIAGDGVDRSLTVFNRQMPGPPIEVCEGDEIVADVSNHLLEGSTSVHWHGQLQHGSQFMDGVPLVTQCPITPLSTFRYKFTAATPGTHFYHSHSGMQRTDGAFGALIVRQPEFVDIHSSLYDEDLSEHTISIIDWSHKLGIDVFTDHHHGDGDNKPSSILINGRSAFFPFQTGDGSSKQTPYASFTVYEGVRYRFRLINAGVLNCPVEIAFDDHSILVISTDGSDIEPVKVDRLVSYAGERWDFVLEANRPVSNYWIRFTGLMDCDERFTSAHTAAVLHYKGAPGALPKGQLSYRIPQPTDKTLNPLNANCDTAWCVTWINSTTPVEPRLSETPNRQIVLAYDFNPKDNPHYHYGALYGFSEVGSKSRQLYTPQLNDISLVLQSFPLLSQPENIKPGMLCDHKKLKRCRFHYCECTNVINLKLGEVVELILIDIGITYDANHPFHLHGHQFRVVGMNRLGHNTSVEEVTSLDAQGLLPRNLLNPVLKDTVTVPDGGYTIVRFIASNPGFWMFHCHIEFHVELGMALLFKIGSYSQLPRPPPDFPRCGDYRPSYIPLDNSIPLAAHMTSTSIPSSAPRSSVILVLIHISLTVLGIACSQLFSLHAS